MTWVAATLLAGNFVTRRDPIATPPAPMLAESAIVRMVTTNLFFMVFLLIFIFIYIYGLLCTLTLIYTRNFRGGLKEFAKVN